VAALSNAQFFTSFWKEIAINIKQPIGHEWSLFNMAFSGQIHRKLHP
jgi:hypothetical protein